MTKLRVVTLNLAFYEHRRWERLKLAADEIKQLDPDILLLQEVSLSAGVEKRLKKLLPGYYFSLCPRGGRHRYLAQAVFSKYKPLAAQRLHLSQNRVAQKVVVKVGRKKLNIINVHLYFSPLRDAPRRRQAQKVLAFAEPPAVIAGDFNTFRNSGSIKLVKTRFNSAHSAKHGREPAKTYPSPLRLGPGLRHWLRNGAFTLLSRVAGKSQGGWGVPIDFIFVEKNMRVSASQVVFDKPAKADPHLFVSDHFGMLADIEL